MSQEWYLIKPPKYVSGFENEDFECYSQSGFEELLSSFMARDVTLYKNRISDGILSRGIFQNVTSDSVSNSSVRQVLFKVNEFENYQYIKDNDRNEIWIVNSLPSDNGFYRKVIAWYCNYNLCFLSPNSEKVIEYPVYSTNVSQSSIGEIEKPQITLGSSRHLIYIPYNEETIMIDHGKRILLDRNHDNPTAYIVTQVDSTTYKYGEFGLLQITVCEDQYSPKRDDNDLLIADYNKNSEPENTGWWKNVDE